MFKGIFKRKEKKLNYVQNMVLYKNHKPVVFDIKIESPELNYEEKAKLVNLIAAKLSEGLSMYMIETILSRELFYYLYITVINETSEIIIIASKI